MNVPDRIQFNSAMAKHSNVTTHIFILKGLQAATIKTQLLPAMKISIEMPSQENLQPETNNNSTTESIPIVKTRCGRIVKTPKHLEDFHTKF